MQNNETMDWEATMTETQQNTQASLRMAENTLDALRSVIDTQKRQAQSSATMLAELRELAKRHDDNHSSPVIKTKIVRLPPPPYRRFWLLGGFAVGVVCGVFLGSW